MSNGQLPAEQISGLAAAIAAAVADLPDAAAADVSFDPGSDLTATDVQAAVLEVYAAIATQMTDAIAAIPSPDAADVGFTPAAGISATDVQAAIVEVRSDIDTAIADLVAGAPGALDTLNEIAAQLGDDEDAIAALVTSLASKLDADDFWTLLKAAIQPGDNVTVDVDEGDRTLTINGEPGGGGGPATTRWEVVVIGSPPEPVLNPAGTDWLYLEVPI